MPMRTVVSVGVALALGSGLGLLPGLAVAQALPQSSPTPATPIQPSAPTNPDGTPLVLPFTDVPSDHWAYQALLNLAGVYGCVSGYPDGTFRGETAVTRYEFAAGMNACMGVLNDLIQQRQQADQQALEALREDLQQSFQELQELEGSL